MTGAERTIASVSELLQLAPLPTARDAASKTREELDELLSAGIRKYTSEDTSLVVFGSLARGEWTSGSDLDWTYLIDGQANSDHLLIAQKIQKLLKDHKEKFRPPGQTGTFGNMAFSHDIIHQIGGQNDTNRNTTQRILLLLESAPIGRSNQAHERIIRGVISRYLEEDTHLLTADSRQYRIPRKTPAEVYGWRNFTTFLMASATSRDTTSIPSLRRKCSPNTIVQRRTESS
jgi:predicted nucleotidyltransferase